MQKLDPVVKTLLATLIVIGVIATLITGAWLGSGVAGLIKFVRELL